jgi:hypothetical protein
MNLKFTLISLMASVLPLGLSAQIANGNLENLLNGTACPTGLDQMNRADKWGSFSALGFGGTPDYYNTGNGCSFGAELSNIAHNGNGFMGVGMVSGNNPNDGFYKEYTYNSLSQALTAGTTYKITFYTNHYYGTSNGMTYDDIVTEARGHLGLCFSSVLPSLSDTEAANLIKNTFAPNGRVYISSGHDAYGLASRNNWVPVTLYFTAQGGEEFMTIGDFWSNVPGTAYKRSYYLFDNFEMTSCNSGNTSPILNNASISGSNIDLSTMITGIAPTGTTLQWHNSSNPSSSSLLSNTTVTASTMPTNYWAYYYDSANNCYSPGAKVTVLGNSCTGTPTSSTVNLSSLIHTSEPSGTTMVWFTSSNHSVGTSVLNPNTVGSGTYWPFFYDATNSCYSPVGTPVTIGVTICNVPCYKSAVITGGTILDTKLGITALGRAGTNGDNWPMLRKGGWIALESKTKGFVLNRVAFSDQDSKSFTPDVPVGIPSANFVEGMVLYDTTNHCLKMFTSIDSGNSYNWYCISTGACPD